MMSEFMTKVTIPIPQTLHDRIALRAEEVGMTTQQLAGVWLWKADYEERMGRKFGKPESRSAPSRDDMDLSARENDR